MALVPTNSHPQSNDGDELHLVPVLSEEHKLALDATSRILAREDVVARTNAEQKAADSALETLSSESIKRLRWRGEELETAFGGALKASSDMDQLNVNWYKQASDMQIKMFADGHTAEEVKARLGAMSDIHKDLTTDTLNIGGEVFSGGMCKVDEMLTKTEHAAQKDLKEAGDILAISNSGAQARVSSEIDATKKDSELRIELLIHSSEAKKKMALNYLAIRKQGADDVHVRRMNDLKRSHQKMKNDAEERGHDEELRKRKQEREDEAAAKKLKREDEHAKSTVMTAELAATGKHRRSEEAVKAQADREQRAANAKADRERRAADATDRRLERALEAARADYHRKYVLFNGPGKRSFVGHPPRIENGKVIGGTFKFT